MVDPEEHQGDDPPTAELPALSPEGTLEQDVLWDDDADDDTDEGPSVRSTGVWVIGGIVALAAIVIGVLLAASATSLAKGGKTPDPVTNTVVVTSTRLTEVTTTRVVTTQPPTSSNPATKKAATKTTTKGGSVSAKATTTSPKKTPKKTPKRTPKRTTTPTTAR